MATHKRGIAVMALLVGSGLLTGCSKPAGNGGQVLAAASTAAQPASACDRHLLTPADLDGVLNGKIVNMKDLPGDPQTCSFETDGFAAITVSVRPGLGKATVDTWASGKMPLKAEPLPGIGESAVWQAELHELIAQQNDVLCDIEARGIATDLAASVGALQQRLGALCGKIFAAR